MSLLTVMTDKNRYNEINFVIILYKDGLRLRLRNETFMLNISDGF